MEPDTTAALTRPLWGHWIGPRTPSPSRVSMPPPVLISNYAGDVPVFLTRLSNDVTAVTWKDSIRPDGSRNGGLEGAQRGRLERA
jgi:hypothetical protein